MEVLNGKIIQSHKELQLSKRLCKYFLASIKLSKNRHKYRQFENEVLEYYSKISQNSFLPPVK